MILVVIFGRDVRRRETRGQSGFLGGDRVAKVMLKVEMDGWVGSKLLNNFIMYLNIGDIKEKHNQENKPKKITFRNESGMPLENNGELVPCVFRFRFLE